MALSEKLAAQGQEYQAQSLPNGLSAFSAERSMKRQNGAAQRRRAVLLLLLVTAAAAAAGQQEQRRPRQQQLRQENHLRQQHKDLTNGSSNNTPENGGKPSTFNVLKGPPKPRGEVTDTLALHTLHEPKQCVNLEAAARCDAPDHTRAGARRLRA